MEQQSVRYLPMTCKTALHAVSGVFPFKKDLNIYRGCENGCKYCFAIYSHKYMKAEEGQGGSANVHSANVHSANVHSSNAHSSKGCANGYYDHIYVKTNVAERLDKELSAPAFKREVINIGGICDSYQSAEAEYELMPDVLRVMIKHKMPAIISTKSDLILRDFDLIDELSKCAFVNIVSTVTTADESVREKIEPGAVSTKRRFDMLEKFKKTDASIGVHMMPVLPLLTDQTENAEAIFSKTREIGADYIIVQTLYLRGQTRQIYFDFIKNEFPALYDDMRTLYRAGGLDKEYKKRFYSMANPLLKKYGLSTDYMRPVREAFENGGEVRQPTLFDFD
ncbi:MAG: radical SAM protein [Methanimicrococcus sp.]|nr:radical SAM protein [Methanimicrococcus sp.]